jgi:hypothetical protein
MTINQVDNWYKQSKNKQSKRPLVKKTYVDQMSN